MEIKDMKGFIEVTERESGMRVLLGVDKITAVLMDTDGVFIETGMDSKGASTGVFVCESYDEVKRKLMEK